MKTAIILCAVYVGFHLIVTHGAIRKSQSLGFFKRWFFLFPLAAVMTMCVTTPTMLLTTLWRSIFIKKEIK